MAQDKLATHLWKDCFIMKEYRNSNFFHNNHGPNGGSGSGSHGPGFGVGGSSSGFKGQGNQGGFNQQSGQGNQLQQSGYQSNPKQLNSGQYHVFTTSLCKRDQKIHNRAMNTVEPVVPNTYDGQSSPLYGAMKITRPGLIIRVS